MKDFIQSAATQCTRGNISALARLLDTPVRTMRYWMAGGRCPGVAAVLFRILATRPDAAQWIVATEKAPRITNPKPVARQDNFELLALRAFRAEVMRQRATRRNG